VVSNICGQLHFSITWGEGGGGEPEPDTC
jgi:hypothetical protein